MMYDKEKIKKIVFLKETIDDAEIKETLEWLLNKYNYFYVKNRDLHIEKEQYKKYVLQSFDLCEKNIELKNTINSLKKELAQFKEKRIKKSCKKKKKMI